MNRKDQWTFVLLLAAVVAVLGMLTAAVRGQEESICRIYNELGRMTDIGSGALIDATETQGFVLSCEHIFSDGVGNIVCVFPDGTKRGGKLIGVDREHDLSAIVIKNPGLPALGIAEPAGTLRVCGYGGEGIYRAGACQVVGQSNLSNIVNTIARSGDSGGPLIDAQNRVVGVVWGSVDGTAYATKTTHLVQFCQQYGICPGGQCRPQQPQIVRPSRPQVVTPTPAPVQSCNCAEKWTAFESRIEYLEQEIKLARETAGQPGPQGERGAPGPVGPAGPAGKDGANAEIDIAAIANEISATLEHSLTLTMPDGTVKTQTRPLSEPLQLIREDIQNK